MRMSILNTATTEQMGYGIFSFFVYYQIYKSGVYYFNWFIIILFIVFMFNGLAAWAFIPASIAC